MTDDIIGLIPVVLAVDGPMTTDEIGAELDRRGEHRSKVDVLATLFACEAAGALNAFRSSSAGGCTMWAVRDL